MPHPPEILEAQAEERRWLDALAPNVPNSINSYLHCKQCIQEWKDGTAGDVSPREYAKLEVGMTLLGLQVWCIRHEQNVVMLDFEGQQHPAR